MPDKKKTTEVDVLGESNVATLSQYFDALKRGFLDLERLRKEQEKKLAEEQKKNVLDLVEKEIALKRMYTTISETEIDALRKKAIADEAKLRKKHDLQIAKEFAEAQLKELKDKGLLGKIKTTSTSQKEREQNHKDNVELYTALKALGKKNRSPEQERQLREISRELGKEGIVKSLNNSINKMISSLDKLNSGIDKYATYSGKINARLQGYNTNATGWEKFQTGFATFGNNAFSVLENRIGNAVGITPYFKTEAILDNLQSLVEQGIAANVEQRAFLQTAKEDIATTFDAANGTLLRIIRLQQRDSTAARLGMEAYLTKYLNELVQTTEYLNQTFDTVAENLVEASSQMTAEASAEFEYVIQKWLGALTGVGMSDTTAIQLAQALGYLGSGNIEALNNSNLQNLLVMAASKANLSYADMLSTGLDAKTANTLMKSLVEYMIQISGSSSNVVRSQFAQTFGLSVSDLRAAQSLEESIDSLSSNFMTYAGMYDELKNQMSAIPGRLNMASMLDTVWGNLEFGLASNIAKNPALAAIWKVTSLIQDYTGGINIPSIFAMGSGFDLNTTVENLVKLGVVGISTLGMIGDLIGGIQSTVNPGGILSRLGITQDKSVISRGTGLSGNDVGGLSTSISAMRIISNSAGDDISEGALAAGKQSAEEEVGQKDSEEAKLKDVKEFMETTMTENMVALQDTMKRVATLLGDGITVRVAEMPDTYNFDKGEEPW